eukprot:scaffold38480_cov23-Tisochrysis_lutea.AAC.1
MAPISRTRGSSSPIPAIPRARSRLATHRLVEWSAVLKTDARWYASTPPIASSSAVHCSRSSGETARWRRSVIRWYSLVNRRACLRLFTAGGGGTMAGRRGRRPIARHDARDGESWGGGWGRKRGREHRSQRYKKNRAGFSCRSRIAEYPSLPKI